MALPQTTDVRLTDEIAKGIDHHIGTTALVYARDLVIHLVICSIGHRHSPALFLQSSGWRGPDVYRSRGTVS